MDDKLGSLVLKDFQRDNHRKNSAKQKYQKKTTMLPKDKTNVIPEEEKEVDENNNNLDMIKKSKTVLDGKN